MKNENFVNSDIENILKTKMSELSDSVDCFDRISARAFPQGEQVFSEEGYTVSGLENITGRSHKPRLLKWSAVAAAAVVCIAILPKTGFIRQVFTNLRMGSVKKNFSQLITEINSEIESGSYTVIDVPLDYYIENDVLVTPLFSCPFEDCGKDDANVKIFIKQIDGINTTQMYAALYTGTYSVNNIIAAAESDFKFTGNEVMSVSDDTEYHKTSLTTIESLFTRNDDGLLMDSDGNCISLASFENTVITKDETGVKKLTSEILYGHTNDSEYFYDILHYNYENELPSPDKMWKKSVYFNGNSAFPEESRSSFTRTELFKATVANSLKDSECEYVYPYDTISDVSYLIDDELHLKGSDSGKQLCSICVPSSPEARLTLKMYFSAFIFSYSDGMIQDKGVTVKDSSNKSVNSFNASNITDEYRIEEFERRARELMELESEQAELMEHEREQSEFMEQAAELQRQQKELMQRESERSEFMEHERERSEIMQRERDQAELMKLEAELQRQQEN